MDPDRQNVGQRLADSEKITINLGFVDLGHIDLLVAENFFANRTDLIRTAIRNLLERHSQALQQSASRRHLVLGLRRYSRGELELARAASEAFNIRVLGLAIIDVDVSTELALATIASIEVLGALQASKDVKRALRDRIH